VDLGVPPGGVCALLGPNGAGKTTVVRVLATLIRPDAGTARVAGHDVLREPGLVRAAIGLAGQHAAVDDDLTGRENLFILGLMHHLGRRRARARAAELLDRFGLADAADRLVKTWSGGMQRRLDLIASLIVAPPVLFLDEPTTGLDPRSRAEIWAAVRALAADGTTVLLTTQYLEEADRIADQIVIIDAGLVTAHGSPDELKDSLGSRIDVVLADAAGLDAAAAALADIVTGPPRLDAGGAPAHRARSRGRGDPAGTRPQAGRRRGHGRGCQRAAARPRRGFPGPHAACRGVPGMSGAFTDGAAAAERVLAKLRHDPTAIALTLGAPVVMVVLFGYIFGSAITVPGRDYRAFLIPGLFATIGANILPSMFAMARDTGRGVVDRFRSLPIARTAVPFGQAAATVVYGLVSFVLMALCGLAVGWRIERGAGSAVAALALLAAFQFAATWVGMYLGLVLGSEQAAGQASILVFPVTMLSNVYVPTSGMPAWLRAIADWNPVSALAAALRDLFGNPGAPANGTWQLVHPVPATLAWTALLLAIFVPLCTRRFART
jgi:ABC-2 type transport system permease protein